MEEREPALRNFYLLSDLPETEDKHLWPCLDRWLGRERVFPEPETQPEGGAESRESSEDSDKKDGVVSPDSQQWDIVNILPLPSFYSRDIEHAFSELEPIVESILRD